jgi:superfamily II DNA or RNA helicase
MSDLTITKKNEVYLKIECEPHIKYELNDEFTFEVPNNRFMPQYRNKWWDGKIHLFNIQTGELYVGLLDKLISFCAQYNYTFDIVENKFYGYPGEVNKLISKEGISDYLKTITKYDVRDYQVQGIYEALKYNRKLILSPTASGKSLMIYCIVKYYVSLGKNIIIIVPTTSLVEQIFKDFKDYGFNSEKYCHRVYGGTERESDKQVTISTWQSIYKLDKTYFKNFDVVIGDECHLFKSKSLLSIMNKLHDTKYRFGFTGTLDGSNTHKLVLEGIFGPVYKLIKTDELIHKGFLSKLKIKVLLLDHNDNKFESYEEEIKYLIENRRRNNFIKNLSVDLKGNTLILYSRVLTHGQPIYELINSQVDHNRKVFFIHGGVDTDERELVRAITEKENNAIIIASYGTFSTGINIKKLHNIIFASPSKSRIRVLQSLGRVLRKSETKTHATLYDIADKITYKGKHNYTLNHLTDRIKIYSEENFDYEINTIDFKNNGRILCSN